MKAHDSLKGICVFFCLYNQPYHLKKLQEEKQMACFLVPAAEAVITTVASKIMQSKETAPETVHISLDGSTITETVKTSFSHKLKWPNHPIRDCSAI